MTKIVGSFTPERSSNPNGKFKRNQSDDSDTGPEKDMGNHNSFTPKK